jgi:hypothetical protein
VLCWSSPRRLTGDAPEYVLLAQRFGVLASPNIPVSVAQSSGLFDARLVDRYGAQQLWHFWLFPLIVAPVMALATKLSPVSPFMIVNIALLTIAFALVYRWKGATAALFICAGPIIWWADKAQSEVFTTTLLAIAFALLSRPKWAALALAIASAQNPPIAVLAVSIAAIHFYRKGWSVLSEWPWWFVTMAIALLHPAFYLWRIGRLTPLVNEGDVRIPAVQTLLAVITDLNIGLVVNSPLTVPILMLVAAAGLKRSKRLAFAAFAALLFLVAFAQAPNVNNGGTPGMSRYCLWLLPIGLSLWPSQILRAGLRRTIQVATAAAVVWNIVWFRPSLPEEYLHPTQLALTIWTRHPTWDNPLPEIFAERLRHKDGANLLASTPGCEKALLQDGQWPTPCLEIPVPLACRASSSLCYANRRAAGKYDFVRTTRRPGIRLW